VSEQVSLDEAPVRSRQGWWRANWRVRGDARSAVLSREILLVLGLSLGASAVYSVMSLISKLTAPAPLSSQTTTLNTSPAPGRPLLALFLELFDLLFSYVVPALFALYLLNRDRDWSPTTARAATRIGLDGRRWRFDVVTGLGLAAVVGVPGLGLYFAARALNIHTDVAAANLTEWWAGPILVLLAFGNGLLEEVVVVGYLVTRLRQAGWGVAAAVTFSAVLRGSYHLYQGFGAFLGNAIMGVIFTLFYLRTKRLWPLVLAHTVLDVIAFLGYTLLHNHVSWL
jgi:membrane protease YdiL (CAAX protease family)